MTSKAPKSKHPSTTNTALKKPLLSQATGPGVVTRSRSQEVGIRLSPNPQGLSRRNKGIERPRPIFQFVGVNTILDYTQIYIYIYILYYKIIYYTIYSTPGPMSLWPQYPKSLRPRCACMEAAEEELGLLVDYYAPESAGPPRPHPALFFLPGRAIYRHLGPNMDL